MVTKTTEMKNLLCLIACFVIYPSISYTQFFWEDTKGPKGINGSFGYTTDIDLYIAKGNDLYHTRDGIDWDKRKYSSSNISVDGNKIANLYLDGEKYKIDFSSYDSPNYNTVVIEEEAVLNDIAFNSDRVYLNCTSQANIWFSVFNGNVNNLHDNNWIKIEPPFGNASKLFTFDDNIFASNSRNFYHHNYNNSTWVDLTPPLELFDDYISDVIVVEDNIFIAGSNALFYSNNFGQSWNTFDFPDSNSAFKLGRTASAVYVHSKGLYKSTDLGETWEMILDNTIMDNFNRLIGFKDTLYLNGFYQGLHKLDESNNQLIEIHQGLSSIKVNDLSIQNDSLIWAAASNNISKFNITEDKWERDNFFPSPSLFYDYIHTANNGWIVCGEESNSKFFLSTNYGEDWISIEPNINGISAAIHNVEVHDDVIYLSSSAFNNKLFFSLDQGFTWQQLGIATSYGKFEIIAFKGSKWISSFDKILQSTNFALEHNAIDLDFTVAQLDATKDFLYALGTNSEGITELYYSQNGEDWNISNFDFDLYPSFYFNSHNRDVFKFFQDQNFQYLYQESIGLFISQNGVNEWSLVDNEQFISTFVQNNTTIWKGKNGVYESALLNPLNENSNPSSLLEEFSLTIFAEDALGNKDSIILGYHTDADDSINQEFGEIELNGIPYDSVFEARAALYDYNDSAYPFHYPTTSESKKLIRQHGCELYIGESNASMLSIKSKNLPITLTWDASQINDPCNQMALVDWLPGGWFDAGGGKVLDMATTNTYTFEATQHHTISYQDTLLNLFFRVGDFINSTNDFKNGVKLLNVFPNPASQFLLFTPISKGTDLFNGGNRIEIYDISGQLVMNSILKSQISIEPLSDGIYFYRLMNTNELLQQGKFIIAK